jgi:hypothetical protein
VAVAGAILFLLIYAGAQFFMARHQVVAFMRDKGDAIVDVHVYGISITNDRAIWVDWQFSVDGGPGHVGDVATETAWLGLGRTRVAGWMRE